jgi:GT2 family glycosyltransferase
MTDIIICGVDNSAMTIDCFTAIQNHTINYQIIYVDNGSNPVELELIRIFAVQNKIPCRLIRNERNEGFVKAVNAGIRASTSEHLVLLNNDVLVTEGWLNKMLDFQQVHPRTGIIGVVTDTGKIQCYMSSRILGLTGYTSGDPADYHNHLPPMVREITASCVPFSCVLLNKAMIREVGLLDTDFSPGYGDDDDYCDRARLSGWRTVILLNVFVYHKHGVTFQSEFSKYDMEKLREANMKLYWRKHAERRDHNGLKII